MNGLKDFKKAYHDILKRDELEQYRKDTLLLALMTEMERTFDIPFLRENEFKKENKEAMDLYHEISRSRKSRKLDN